MWPARCRAGRGPVIVTCRAAWEGGYFKGTEAARLALLEQAWHAGADFVDIEFAAWREAAWVRQTGGERLVVSSHDFAGMPADLASRYRAMAATGAAVVKLAVTAAALADCVPLLAFRPTGSAAPGRAGHGRARSDHAADAAAIRVGLDLRRARRGAGADAAAAVARGVPLRRGRRRRRALRHRRQPGRAFGLAGHAQRRASRRQPQRRVPAAAGRGCRRRAGVCRGVRRARPQRHAAVQGGPAAALRARRARQARGRREHAGPTRRGRGADSTPTCRACWRRWPNASTWRACARPSSARAARRAAPPSRCRAPGRA